MIEPRFLLLAFIFIIGALGAVLVLALVRLGVATRAASRRLRVERDDNALVTEALGAAVTQIREREEETNRRAVVTERLSEQIIGNLSSGLPFGAPQKAMRPYFLEARAEPERSCLRRHFTHSALELRDHSLPSTVRRFRRPCSSQSYSGTRKARSPAPMRASRADSRSLIMGPCFWTRSATSRSRSRPRSSGPSRSGRSSV